MTEVQAGRPNMSEHQAHSAPGVVHWVRPGLGLRVKEAAVETAPVEPGTIYGNAVVNMPE